MRKLFSSASEQSLQMTPSNPMPHAGMRYAATADRLRQENSRNSVLSRTHRNGATLHTDNRRGLPTAPPAVAALFLYSLLPIARNTHAGLTGIPASLRESAEALGLSPWAILWRIELPLAAPTILAGIRTSLHSTLP